MSETSIPIIIAVLTGGLAKAIFDAIVAAAREAREARRAERAALTQATRDAGDDLQEALAECDRQRLRAVRWMLDSAHVRQIALAHGVPADQLPPMPTND